MNNISYEIKPVFTPSATICHDFARVQISSLSSQEKLSFYKQTTSDCFDTLPPKEKPLMLAEMQTSFVCNDLARAYLNAWNMEPNVFAFAAYDAKEMVGFITGSLTGKNMFTRGLYVMPKYQSYGIGTSLLDSAENATSLVAPNMELFSLPDAVSFYENRGYKNDLVLGRIIKIKKLSNATGIIPVFQWCEKLQSRLNMKFDTNLLKEKEHQPIFVYVNRQQKIDGIAIRMSNGEQKISVNSKRKNLSQFYTQKLSEALNRSL